MYQEPIIATARVDLRLNSETGLRSFFEARYHALATGAAVLAGRKGARIVEEIRSGLEQPGPISRWMAARLFQLFDILALRNVHDEDSEEASRFAAIDPADPIVDDLCLLTDELCQALRSADLDPFIGRED